MNIIGKYKNGNYNVMILSDGTKIRYNHEDKLIPEFPESMDIKINNKCNMMCPMCHEGATPDGCNPDILNIPFIDSLHPYTELAIGGGNPLQHPDLLKFLRMLKDHSLIPSMTVHQHHFMENLNFLHYLVDNHLIYGLGISLVDPDEKNFVSEVKKIPNAVIHVINGLVNIDQLKSLSNKNFKILILGYKEFRRGKDLYEKKDYSIHKLKNQLYYNLEEIINNRWFNTVSFDNLAIKQLEVKRLMTDEKWNEFYMGDDGQFTMYVDLVNKTFSTSSTTPIDQRHPLTNNIIDMFNVIRSGENDL